MFEAFRQRFAGHRSELRFLPETWDSMVAELSRRGEGRRESGAFLLARRHGNAKLVSQIVYFDDLDPDCLKGHIHLRGEAYPKLWSLCDREDLLVIGDVHTHPKSWVDQSAVDADNPMVAKRGHVALIIPNYARKRFGVSEVGVHIYRGEAGWTSFLGKD